MSFQQALSGLNAASKNLEVIGNNVANANTFGNKSSRAEFADMYAAAMNGAGANAVGIGVNLAAVAQQFTQGNISTTDNPMDLALNGPGFFQVSDGQGAPMYTRNGQFHIDRDGRIVNNQRLQLMGYPADASGTIQPGTATALQLPTAGITPAVTTRVTLEVNLDSRVATTAPAAAPAIDFGNPATYNNATSLLAYDDKGQEIALSYYFQKAGNDQWNVFATVNGAPAYGTAAAPQPLPGMPLQFSANGAGITSPAQPMSFDIPASTNSAGALTLPVAGVLLDMSGATQYGAGFGVTNLAQDGFAPGQLAGVVIDSSGVLMARYTNGQTKPAGQLALASFRNPQGLQPMGGNAWVRTRESGDPVVGVAGQGNLGVLQAGALEESNVDLTAELVNMITAQRVYQANAQTVKTLDTVMQTLVNLR